jgi:uncharacterized membrane protein (DUF441 family)
MMRQVVKSKTMTVNAIVFSLLVAYLNFKGIDLSPEELQLTGSLIAGVWFGINVFLRSITKKPLMEKKNLRE